MNCSKVSPPLYKPHWVSKISLGLARGHCPAVLKNCTCWLKSKGRAIQRRKLVGSNSVKSVNGPFLHFQHQAVFSIVTHLSGRKPLSCHRLFAHRSIAMWPSEFIDISCRILTCLKRSYNWIAKRGRLLKAIGPNTLNDAEKKYIRRFPTISATNIILPVDDQHTKNWKIYWLGIGTYSLGA